MDGHAHQESPEASLIDVVAGLGTENHTRCKTAGGYRMMAFASIRRSLSQQTVKKTKHHHGILRCKSKPPEERPTDTVAELDTACPAAAGKISK